MSERPYGGAEWIFERNETGENLKKPLQIHSEILKQFYNSKGQKCPKPPLRNSTKMTQKAQRKGRFWHKVSMLSKKSKKLKKIRKILKKGIDKVGRK